MVHKFSTRRGQKHTPLVPPRRIEAREWWMWGLAVTVTLALAALIIFLTFFDRQSAVNGQYWVDLKESARGLAALVLMFDIYTLFQHYQLQKVRRELASRNRLFQLITENAADMIAVVDNDGNRLYNSPSYHKTMGYSQEELTSSSGFQQIHPSDRERVLQAAAKARLTGEGQRLEYRMQHKDGTWRILESTASVIHNADQRIEGLVIVNRDISERKRAEEMLKHSAFYDGLTDLPNRILFSDRLQHAVLRARRHSDYKFAVLFIDVDGFKVLNDSLGHSAGDELLILIAKRLTVNFRDTDTLARSGLSDAQTMQNSLARLGGDEFTVLLEDVLAPSDAIRVAQRIQAKLAAPFEVKGQQMVISASIGIACSARSYSNAEELLRDAEIAMYRAKQAGKARWEMFDPAMHSSAVNRLKLETELRRGIENKELVVYYQPIVSLKSERIVGFEALSRWQRPEGLVSPGEFIPVADETGLIVPMNREVVREACKQLRSWQLQFDYDPPLTMSINLASKQLEQSDLAAEIGTVMRETGVVPEMLSFEIMETVAMGDIDRALPVLSGIKALGARISIDDFGTGYSSLSRLPRLPIDILKIDRAFISNMSSDRENHEIVRLIILLAHTLNLKVVAEGTETREQINALKELGCEMAQGYFYSPPVSSQAAFGLLARGEIPALQS
jgi:diguanylate cyclase (GGDEF)-like protein/PAS domain S-box-containing protein